MSWWLSKLLTSGSKQYHHLTADSEKELKDAARRLGTDCHGKGSQHPHLDINRHQAQLAIRYGAQLEEEE